MSSPDPNKVSTSFIIPAGGDRYRLFGLLGEIGDGGLYHAVNIEDEGRVGFLRVDEENVGPLRMLQYMEAAEASGHDRHQAVAKVLEFDEADDGLYVCFERLEGHTARQHLLASGPLLPHLALEVTLRVLDAVLPWHDSDEAFGSVCAETVIIDADAERLRFFKLLPPSMALLLLEEKPDDEGLESRMAANRAPEVLLGDAPTPAADIFAAGVLLYELLTAEWPFASSSQAREQALVISADAPPLRDMGYEGLLAPELDRVLASMMAKRVDGRVSDARGAIVALRRVYQAFADLAFHDMSTVEVAGEGLAAARAAWATRDEEAG